MKCFNACTWLKYTASIRVGIVGVGITGVGIAVCTPGLLAAELVTVSDSETRPVITAQTHTQPRSWHSSCLFVCLGFNGTFSTNRLHRAI